MLWKDTPKSFGLISIALHWVTAISVLTLLATGLVSLEEIWYGSGERGGIGWFNMNLHVAMGSVTLPFIVWRVWWRVREGHPREPKQNPLLEKITALNWPLILMLIVLCFVTGVYLMWLHGNTLWWFDRTPLHPPIYPRDVPELNWIHTVVVLPIHIWASITLGCILFLHIAGAMKHWIIDKDGVLERMLRPGELRRQDTGGKLQDRPADAITE